MNKFNWDLINQPNTVVHCETEEQAKELLTESHNNGFKWASDEPYIYSNYINTKYNYIQHCYDINKGQMSSIRWYNDKNYKILKFEECKIMNKLLDVDFIIQKDNKTIVLDIKHMDESLRKGNSNPIIKSDCGEYIVYSIDSPQIGIKELFLRGAKKEKDNKFTYYTFNSTEEMNEYIKNMNKLIDEINNPIIEIDINEDDRYEFEDYNINIGRNDDDNWIEIKISKNIKHAKGLKFYYISEDEINGQPLDEVVEEFDNFCKRRNIKAKLVR